MEKKVEEEQKSTGEEKYLEPLSSQEKSLDDVVKETELGYGGGIIVDEAFLGKSIESVLLAIQEQPLSKTLIIAPVLSMSQWEEDIAKLSKAKVFVFDDGCKVEDLTAFDFVITSHATVKRGYKTVCCPHCHKLLSSVKPQHFCDKHRDIKKKGKTIGPLHSTEWERVFLDEGHLLEGGDQAIFALKAKFRWILTSRLYTDHLYPLLRFLQTDPYSLHFCLDCKCNCADLGFWTKCPTCRHKSSDRHSHWLEKYKFQGGIATCLTDLCLRPSKGSLSLKSAFPPSYVTVRRDDPTKAEKKMYKQLKSFINKEFAAYFQDESLMENYARIHCLINRLKQASMHLDLVDLSDFCGICGRASQEAIVLPCTHIYCRDCLFRVYPCALSASAARSCCPTCGVTFKRNLLLHASLKGKRKPDKAEDTNSIILRSSCTKIEALREEITWMLGTDESAKAVIFSRYKSFLELIERQLTKSGLRCVKLSESADGKAALQRFKEDGQCKILLTTFEIVGDLLDLSVASHVFLMDPGWNPITDRQALARVQTVRQSKPTRMVKFISKGTIEEKIIDVLQEKQNTLAGVDDYCSSIEKLTEEEMGFLFSD
ncbi:unnamed protein product [Arabidopsis lyrata]|uniref:RING-type domain-containing protein n=1 Tax=Arabidopsis lyrata subsp. lyrata TaxID=81972 RepID=D7KKK4_ARALL|nr:DNA repair protein RAD16 [Arabidopsis lyrata subsp. lyrata]EFH68799.1 hypothetical protein ARALYDRAFT_888252 [Arabidopsis lyrata subsp. lyrata]CAH8251756.1 unnamed protein product [Arabidopsis lyrata]|eukprot:XP_002892540.1 DNA repair protein RAD16 [Arabidopsis lyrata subsp. lyrata]